MEDGTKLFDDLADEKVVTPEKVRTMMVLIKQSIDLRNESIRTLRELEATLANKVGVPKDVFNPRFAYWEKSHCEACGSRFNDGYTHRVVEFDGRYWHRHNCMKKKEEKTS